MLIFLLVAFLGGMASILTPCVLPVLPAVFAISAGEGRMRLWGIVMGITTSFLGIAIVLATALSSLPPNLLPRVASALMIGFGLVLIVPVFEHAFQKAIQGLVSRVPTVGKSDGFIGGLLSGLTLGVIWAPCAGPILASITSGASSLGICTSQTVITMLAYGLGMTIPLIALVFGGRRLALFLRKVFGSGRKVSVVMGVILVSTGVVYGVVGINTINREISAVVDISSTPLKGLEERVDDKKSCNLRSGTTQAETAGGKIGNRPALSELQASGYPSTAPGELENLGRAPDFVGNSRWFNTPNNVPLVMEQLRGKVVLVDFWTYSCINCIRTQPHLRDLYKKYKKKGLVIVGVHSPEFQFEKDEGNVRRAIEDLDVTWPVALDNDMETWTAYFNNYWPAHYLIDKDGIIRSTHYGEGGYSETEDLVRELLVLPSMDTSANDERAGSAHPLTPETYLGFRRADADTFAGIESGSQGIAPGTATYRTPKKSGDLGLDVGQWAFSGTWLIEQERSIAVKNSNLHFAYAASDVFLVLGPPANGSVGTVTIHDGSAAVKTINVDAHKLYTLRDTDNDYTQQRMTLEISPGVSAYAFTFG